MAFRKSDANCLDIGLINNMPDAALEATERQFRSLLTRAADGIAVRLTLYALPDIPRTDAGRRHVNGFYSDIGALWNSHLDGLIVTGAEPRAQNLAEEPFWRSLTEVLEWAERHTSSTVWSCLAAHAAVLYMDGVDRRPLGDKRFGVFDCAPVSNHPLTAAAPSRMYMPHSRWNDLPEDTLTSCGYRMLTRSHDAGVDAFVRQRKSLFIFFQGHPEYDATSLLLEYRRDIGRFLRRERDTYPTMPVGYFDQDVVDRLLALRARAMTDRREELLADVVTALMDTRVVDIWRPTAACLYRNWLRHVRAQKEQQLRVSTRMVPIGGVGHSR